jgi:hypothetical protein
VAQPAQPQPWPVQAPPGFQPGVPPKGPDGGKGGKPISSRSGVFLIGAVAAVLLVLFLLPRFVQKNRAGGSSASLLRPYSKPMLLGSVAVSPSQVRYWKFEVSPTMTNAHVTGEFHASGGSGNDIEATVAEWDECENWINGHQANVLYASGKVTNGALDVPIRQAGTYCLACSNKMGLLSGKTVSGIVALQYLLP